MKKTQQNVPRETTNENEPPFELVSESSIKKEEKIKTKELQIYYLLTSAAPKAVILAENITEMSEKEYDVIRKLEIAVKAVSKYGYKIVVK